MSISGGEEESKGCETTMIATASFEEGKINWFGSSPPPLFFALSCALTGPIVARLKVAADHAACTQSFDELRASFMVVVVAVAIAIPLYHISLTNLPWVNCQRWLASNIGIMERILKGIFVIAEKDADGCECGEGPVDGPAWWSQECTEEVLITGVEVYRRDRMKEAMSEASHEGGGERTFKSSCLLSKHRTVPHRFIQ